MAGEELEKFRDILCEKGLSVRMGYDETYNNDNVVDTGYLHYNKDFYLSKNSLNKKEITFTEIDNLN